MARLKFKPGDGGTLDDGKTEWRIFEGKKGNGGDVILRIRIPEWTQPTHELLYLQTDVYCQVEDNLYPPPRFMGSEMLLKRLYVVRRKGWRFAWRLLQREKESKVVQEKAA